MVRFAVLTTPYTVIFIDIPLAMSTYRRFYIPGATWFFTVNLTERHKNRLLVERIEVLRAAFAEVKTKHPFRIDGIVILPEHLYCILTRKADSPTAW